ncbi:MAG: class I SAM-dependent DNA methyltransferase [Planctomycetota bacterium]|jgi:SAM-dependent methyltransferase
MSERNGIRGDMARFYDVFIDWEGRLGRELPGIRKRLEEAGARRVLDLGCGTGRHVDALRKAGYDAHGSDISEEMLEQARQWTGEPERFHSWGMGTEPPSGLLHAAPFDALLCVGNVWPQIRTDAEIGAACAALLRLLRPGGLLLMGLKAVAIRRETGTPYMPLLRREHEGKPLWFIRFVEFEEGNEQLCRFHMVVVGGEAEVHLHETHAMRIWSPESLARTFREAGFADVSVSGRMDDPAVPPTTEDVFLHARALQT